MITTQLSTTNQLSAIIQGHCHITDDLGNVLLDKCNAIHPQNIARVFARALADESNYFINRIALGNGGTYIDSAYTITYRTPNDGQSPDTLTWNSRLYHETFSKIIDAGQVVLNPTLGQDLGSADVNTGVRFGGGSVPSNDPASILHVSGPGVRSTDLGLTSEVVITATINASEPTSQYLTDTLYPTENTAGTFVFDEIGLYTGGAQALNMSGYQNIDVGNRTSTDNCGLQPATNYSFTISVDGGIPLVVNFTTPVLGGSGTNGTILYGDLCQAINTGDTTWGFTGASPLPANATVSITDFTNGAFSTITGSNTYGFLQFSSGTNGNNSAILLENSSWSSHTTITSLLPSINNPLGGILIPAVVGTVAGVQNSPLNPATERERLLTHLIFSPITKTANRLLNIVYTLTISIARTPTLGA